jgi:type II secretory ATPase GspE/PulE/Tfp pilus assembly ATPase PilB-like protein
MVMASLIDIFSKPQGMLLITGPTGSGKTTTLYSILQQLQRETKNIITIEDPVEYKLKRDK